MLRKQTLRITLSTLALAALTLAGCSPAGKTTPPPAPGPAPVKTSAPAAKSSGTSEAPSTTPAGSAFANPKPGFCPVRTSVRSVRSRASFVKFA